MKKIRNAVKRLVVKHGGIISVCAFAFVTVAANSTCAFPYYEPEEPGNLSCFKKLDK